MSLVSDLLRLLVVGCFAFAGLLGILVLLAGGEFGETELRILNTTVVVGVECVAALTYLAAATVGRTAVAGAGAAASLAATAIVLFFVWGGSDSGDVLWRVVLTAIVVALSLAQTSLLLVATGGRVSGEGRLLGTLALVAIVALMVVLPMWDVATSDTYWRLFGVVTILDVLGTIVVAVTRRRPDERMQAATLSTGSRLRLEDVARSRGVTPDQLVDDLLR